MLQVDPGFRSEHVLTARISMPPVGYRAPASVRSFADSILQRVRMLSGVKAAGLTSASGAHGARR